MEIFSNIWNVLTTENEFVTKLFTIPTVPIEAWLGIILITNILKLKLSQKQEILYIVFLTVISLISKFIIPSPYNILFNYLFMFIEIKIILKTNIIKTILCTIFPTIVFALVGCLILKPFLLLINSTYSMIEIIPIYRLVYLTIVYLIILLLLIIMKKISFNIDYLDGLTKKNRKIIIINLLFGFFILSIQAILTAYYVSIVPIALTFLNFIALLVYFFIVMFSLTKTMKLQMTSQNLENAEIYNSTLSYLYDNVKAFKHDFDNMVFIIGGYIQNNDLGGLKSYYKNFEKDCERVNELALLNPELINNSGIYNLLMSKYKKANENNVEIHLEYFFDLTKLHMPIYEFSRMLGILLDNAIEGAKDSKEKQIKIMFRDSQRNNTQIISIENSYNNKDVDTLLIFEKGKTSKENHTGMGLWEVKQLLNRNNNVNLSTTKDEKLFKQTLEIYY